MSITGGEQLTEQIIISSSKAGMEVTAKVSQLSAAALKFLMNMASTGLHKLPTTAGHREHGKMTIKNLQRRAGGDLHAQQVSTELLKSVQHDLKKRGVDFSVEKGADSMYYVHFKGADVDTVRHALTQAEAKISTMHAPSQEAVASKSRAQQDPKPGEGHTPAAAELRTVLVEHGPAPFEHAEDASPSYFVTTENARGEQSTVWGVDLERAIKESGANIGDAIEITQQGSVPVTLPNGIETHRNNWKVDVKETHQVASRTDEMEILARDVKIEPVAGRRASMPHGTTILAVLGERDKQSVEPQTQGDIVTRLKEKAYEKSQTLKTTAPKPSKTRSQSR